MNVAGDSNFDYNRDGIPDFAVGDPWITNAAGNVGRIYVFSGVNGGLITQLVYTPANFPVGFASALNVGDFNGDGYGEVFTSTTGFPIGVPAHPTRLLVYTGPTNSLLYSYVQNPPTLDDFVFMTSGDVSRDGLDEIVAVRYIPSLNDGVSLFVLGGVYSYGSGTLTASWLPVQGLGSQGAVSFTGFNPGEQNICIALSGSPANIQISPWVNVYVNPNDPVFWIDCSFTADFAGTVTFPNLNIQNAAVAGQKVYAQAAKSDLSATSNGLEITFLP